MGYKIILELEIHRKDKYLEDLKELIDTYNDVRKKQKEHFREAIFEGSWTSRILAKFMTFIKVVSKDKVLDRLCKAINNYKHLIYITKIEMKEVESDG